MNAGIVRRDQCKSLSSVELKKMSFSWIVVAMLRIVTTSPVITTPKFPSPVHGLKVPAATISWRVCAVISISLATDLVVSNTDGASTEAVGPEALHRWGAVNYVSWQIEIGTRSNLRACHAVMGEEKPEAKDWLGEDIKDSIGDDLSIKTNHASTVSNTPDAIDALAKPDHHMQMRNVHWVDSPEDQSEASNGSEESLGLSILVGGGSTAVESELVDDDEVGNASNGVPSPLGSVGFVTEGSEETGEDHNEIGNNGHKDAGTIEAGEESQVEKQEWRGDGPVNISCPVDLTVSGLECVWDVLVGLNLDDLVVADSVTAGHGVVREEGKGGDESSQDVEQAFLLRAISSVQAVGAGLELTTGTLKAIP
jgi:hypothetical protein